MFISWFTIVVNLSWSCCNPKSDFSHYLSIYTLHYAKSLGKAVAVSVKSIVKNPTKISSVCSNPWQCAVLLWAPTGGSASVGLCCAGVVGQDSRMSTHHPLQQVSSLTNLDHAADKVFDTCPHRQTAHEKQRGQLHAVVAWRHDCMTAKPKEDSTKTIITITMKYSTRIYLLINIAYRLHFIGKPNSLQRLLQIDINKSCTCIEPRKEARFLVFHKLPKLSAVRSWTSNFHLKTVHWLDWGQGLWMASSWNRTWPMARLQAHGVWRSMLLFENIFMVLMN